jgi:hypothetical protein
MNYRVLSGDEVESEPFTVSLSEEAAFQSKTAHGNTPETAQEPQELHSNLSMGVSFQTAAQLGLKGRVVWAVFNLGRNPLLTRVFEKAQDPQAEKPDTREAFNRVLRELVSERVLELVSSDPLSSRSPDRCRMALNSPNASVACRCSFCSETGPAAKGKEEAKKAALEAGFTFIENEGRIYCLCPAHTQTAPLVPGGPALNAAHTAPAPGKENWAARKKRLKAQRKASQVAPVEKPKGEPFRTNTL